MPGLLRFFLSALVIFSHLSGAPGTEYLGYFAVRAFFVLSGIVLTKSLHETYQFNFFNFYSNRLLRIVPLYFLVCATTIVIVRLFPQEAASFMPRWAFEENDISVLQNFLLLPLAFGYLKLRYLEPAWSLAVELVMYLLLWAGISRSQRLAMFALIFGAVYHIILLTEGAPFSARYFSIASAILSYAIGATVYFNYGRLKDSTRLGPIAAILWFCNLIFGYYVLGDHVYDVGFYVNTLLFGLAAPYLLEAPIAHKLRAHDQVLGHLSYPVFLVQWLAGFVGFLVMHGMEERGVFLFYTSMPIVVAMGALLFQANERMIEPIRHRLRSGLAPWRKIEFSASIKTDTATTC